MKNCGVPAGRIEICFISLLLSRAGGTAPADHLRQPQSHSRSTDLKLPLSLRGRKPAPQGGLSCPAGNSPSGNPFSFRPLRGRAARCTAGDSDCHGLRPRNDGGCFALVLLIWLCNCPTGSAWAVPHALQKTPDAAKLHRVFLSIYLLAQIRYMGCAHSISLRFDMI